MSDSRVAATRWYLGLEEERQTRAKFKKFKFTHNETSVHVSNVLYMYSPVCALLSRVCPV